jgi:Leucine-rich repeat (LRR) protein
VNGGIVIPDTAKEKPQNGVVVAVGKGKILESGSRAKMASVFTHPFGEINPLLSWRLNMRKPATLSLLLWIWLGLSAIQAQSFFPDSNLDAAVRKQVFAGDKMTEDDLKRLSTLKATGAGIRDLKGLEKCANLAALDLADNQITDLSPLKGLTNLQTLTLSANRIQDIGPLSDLRNLQYLELSRNEISEITSLGKLTELSALYLSRNRISNIRGIQNLHKLCSLYLDGNKVSDLKPLADIRNLSSLDLSGNQVSDLSPISNMKYLRYLSVNNNRLSDLKPLVVMSKSDSEGEKSFAPYLFLAVNGNPLSTAGKTQLAELKGYGVRLELAERAPAGDKSVDALKAPVASSKKKASTETKK